MPPFTAVNIKGKPCNIQVRPRTLASTASCPSKNPTRPRVFAEAHNRPVFDPEVWLQYLNCTKRFPTQPATQQCEHYPKPPTWVTRRFETLCTLYGSTILNFRAEQVQVEERVFYIAQRSAYSWRYNLRGLSYEQRQIKLKNYFYNNIMQGSSRIQCIGLGKKTSYMLKLLLEKE